MVAGCYPTTSLLYRTRAHRAAVSGNNFRFGTFAELELLGYPATAMVAMDLWKQQQRVTPTRRATRTSCTSASYFGASVWVYMANNWTPGGTPFSSVTSYATTLAYALQPLRGHALRKGPHRARRLRRRGDRLHQLRTLGHTGSVIPTSPCVVSARPTPVACSRYARSTARAVPWLDPSSARARSRTGGTVESGRTRRRDQPELHQAGNLSVRSESMPGTMGEAQQIVLADMDRDGDKDLVIATSTGTYSGQVIVLTTSGARERQPFPLSQHVDAVHGQLNSSRSRTWTETAIRTSCSARRRARPRGHPVYRNTHATSTWTYRSARASAPGCAVHGGGRPRR